MLEYCSVNLLEQNDEYKNKYFQIKRDGGEIMLHHGNYGQEYLNYWIGNLKPKYYVIPNSSSSVLQTIEIYKEFIKKYKSLPNGAIGTISGKNFDDLFQSFTYFHDQDFIKGIYFPCYVDFFNDMYDNKEKAQKFGRDEFINEILSPFYVSGKYWKPIFSKNIKILG